MGELAATRPRTVAVLLVALAFGLVAIAHPSAAAPSSVSGTDAYNDEVNPVLQVRPPVIGYQFASIDIRSWSLSADGSNLTASLTVDGSIRGWIFLAVGGALPGFMVSFNSPRLAALCPPCGVPGTEGWRIGFIYRYDPCPAIIFSYVIVFDESETIQIALAQNVPVEISADGHTITWRIPYTIGGYTVAAPGDVLTNVSANTVGYTEEGFYTCPYVSTRDGVTDWAPQNSWDPILRRHRPTGLSIQA